ncbi:MAG TPA: 50S ribosomal protein L17 [Rectinemataceae bacterium]|nr:50S ribosomal protein L17 [Treponema sp.]HUW41960.1 50S ribosomal protein L17 [Rectinemataceae bacterium]
MKHKTGFNKLNRVPAHRKALIRNMMTVLFKHESITTTRAKAMEVRRFAEKEITRAKEDSVHNRRMTARKIQDEAILAKLYTDIGPRFKERAGGYTRVLRLGFRQHDAADMVVLELVDRKEDTRAAERQKRREEKRAKARAEAANQPR